MPVYEVTDPASGRIVELTGDSPPTDQDLDEIFSSLPPVEPKKSGTRKALEFGADVLSGRALRDVVGTVGSAMVAEPVAGYAGIIDSVFENPERGGQTVRDVRDTLTLQPKTEAGRMGLNAIGKAISPATDAIEGASQFTGDIGESIGGPVGGAIGYTVPGAVLEILGLKGTRQAKAAALKAEIAENPSVLTPEVQKVLEEQGFADVAERIDPDQALRLERFSQFDTKPTQGELTQRLQDQKPEQALLESSVDETGKTLQAMKRDQSTAIRASVDKTIDSLGVPVEVGTSVKDILSSRKQVLKETRRNAYEKLSQATEGQNIPVITNSLLKGMPDKGTRRTIEKTLANQAAPKALDDLLIEFGIEADPAAVQKMADSGVEITPLSLSNSEAFRRRLGFISKSDPTGQIEVLIGPIRENLDAEIDLMSQTLERSGNPNVAEFAKQARQSNIALKTEFDPKSITEKLISKKTNSVLPNIEESRVYQTVAANSLPVEEVTRLVDSLEATGSKKAVGDLQSAMLLDLIDSAYSASSRKIDGVPTFGGPAFQKRYQQLAPKLDVIFRSNPEALQRIKALNEVAKDLTPPSGAVPKGSAGFLVDSLQRIGVMKIASLVPGGGVLAEGLTSLSQKAKNRQVLNRAMKASPELRESANVLATDYPGLAAALGIGYLSSEKESSSSPESRNR
jgi:hypothetical protein